VEGQFGGAPCGAAVRKNSLTTCYARVILTFVFDEELSSGSHVGDVDVNGVRRRREDQVLAPPSATAEHRLSRAISGSGPLHHDHARDVIAATSGLWVRDLKILTNRLIYGWFKRSN